MAAPIESGFGRAARDQRVRVAGGVELNARVWEPERAAEGIAPAFLMLHGIASSSVGWEGVARHLARSGRRAWAIDFRGHGLSDRPDGGYDLATFAADLTEALDGLGLTRPVLVGHSLGANVILRAIAARPDLAAGVALVEGALVDARDQFASLEETLARMALPPVDGMPLARLVGHLRQSNRGWTDARLAAAVAAFDVHADGTVSWRLTQPRFEALLSALWEERVADRWPAIQVPAVVVVADTGDAKWTAAKRAAESSIRGVLPALRVEWLTADHDVHTDKPTEVAGLLLDAFAER